MATNYLEFDSAYRNRQLYPKPTSFVVEIGQSGQNTKDKAIEPISASSPILYWNTSFANEAAATSITLQTIQIPGTTDPNIIVVSASGSQEFKTVENFYIGAVIQLTDGAGVIVRRRIVGFKWLAAQQAQITLDSALPNTFPSGGAGALAATSNIANPGNNTSTATTPQLFIPGNNIPIDNYYKGYVVQNIETGDTLTITSYDGTTRLATLSGNSAVNWSGNDINLALRKVAPTNTGTFLGISSTNRTFQLASTASNISGEYVSGYLRMTEPVPVAPDLSTGDAPFGEERRITSYITGDGTFVAIGAASNTFTLAPGASTVDNYYVGSLITNSTVSETRQILTYSGSTRSGTVSVNWGGAVAAGNSWFIRSATIETGFSVAPAIGVVDTYEVEGYTRDGVVNFNYIGSMVALQQDVCYEVEVLNLVLPNLTLASGRGGRPAFYPYLYLQVEQVSSSMTSGRGLIYSNNPNSNKMMFRCVVDDTPTPLISPFIKIDGDGMVHTIKFRPNDSFKIGVYHANGELFETVMQDTSPPTEPNPLVQMSLCLAFKRKNA